MMGFVALGPAAKPATDELMRLAEETNSVRFATLALAAIGQDGVRAAVIGLRSTNVVVRREIAGVLGTRGITRFATNASPERIAALHMQAEIAVPALITACSDEDEFVRARAATALGLLGQKPELAIPVLIKSLGETNGSWRVPTAAAKALGRFGTNAIPAIRALQDALQGNDSRIRAEAETTLRFLNAR
jgi:HEAT repeat protein